MIRWVEDQEDHSKKAKDLRHILSAEAFRFFIARNMGVNSGQQDKTISGEHPFWQDVSDTVRKLSAGQFSPPPKDHPLYGLKQTINAFARDLAQDFQRLFCSNIFEQVFHAFTNKLLRIHLTPIKEQLAWDKGRSKARRLEAGEGGKARSLTRKEWWRRCRKLQGDFGDCLQGSDTEERDTRMAVLTQAMRHMIKSEPTPTQGNGLQSIEEELAKTLKPSTTAALESELADTMTARISADEAKDWLSKEYLEHEEGTFKTLQIIHLPIPMPSFTQTEIR